MSAVISDESASEALVRQLYMEHGRALLSYVSRLTMDYEIAEDVVQETLIRAWRHAALLDPTVQAVRGWLLVTARHIVIDKVRAKKRRPQEVYNEVQNTLLADGDHSEHVVNCLVVRSALRELPPHHRVVVQQVYLEGRSLAETADALRVPVGTVKSRCHYAIRALHTMMAPAWA
jgi:RNA polymerase sigma-70 factor (ECF subfamily)